MCDLIYSSLWVCFSNAKKYTCCHFYAPVGIEVKGVVEDLNITFNIMVNTIRQNKMTTSGNNCSERSTVKIVTS